jgi:hypothetical protein
MSQTCLDCALASWSVTKNGRLHPDGSGRCMGAMERLSLPKAFYYVGYRDNQQPLPSGGYLDRRKPYTDCPQFQQKEVS